MSNPTFKVSLRQTDDIWAAMSHEQKSKFSSFYEFVDDYHHPTIKMSATYVYMDTPERTIYTKEGCQERLDYYTINRIDNDNNNNDNYQLEKRRLVSIYDQESIDNYSVVFGGWLVSVFDMNEHKIELFDNPLTSFSIYHKNKRMNNYNVAIK